MDWSPTSKVSATDTTSQWSGAPQYCERITEEAFKQQKGAFTKSQVEQLKNTPEYQHHIATCTTCGANWWTSVFNHGCKECGGAAMTRSCPICDGECGRRWNRDLQASHSWREAMWDGECGLPQRHQQYLWNKQLTQNMTVDQLADLMDDM